MKLKMCGTQSVLTLLALCVGLAHSWDIAVSYGDELKFYTFKTLISTIRLESRNITALAYDDKHNMILYVDKQTNGDAICGYNITSVESNCFTERTGRNIYGIAYDSMSDTVFFTDTNERTVNSFSLRPGAQNNPRGNLLIKISEGIPRDIIVDSCNWNLYWLNTDKPNPTIERAQFTGTKREVFQTLTSVYINATLTFEPDSLAIDPKTRNIYWFEPWNSTHSVAYYVSALTNTQKNDVFDTSLVDNPVFIHPSNTIAVSDRFFLVNVFALRKELKKNEDHGPYMSVLPVGIVANYQIKLQYEDIAHCLI